MNINHYDEHKCIEINHEYQSPQLYYMEGGCFDHTYQEFLDTHNNFTDLCLFIFYQVQYQY